MYKIVIEPQQHPPYKSDGDHKVSHNNASPTMYLFALGITLPFVIVEPLYFIDFLDVKNLGLRMVFLATPIVNGLRITEGKISSEEVYIAMQRKSNMVNLTSSYFQFWIGSSSFIQLFITSLLLLQGKISKTTYSTFPAPLRYPTTLSVENRNRSPDHLY